MFNPHDIKTPATLDGWQSTIVWLQTSTRQQLRSVLGDILAETPPISPFLFASAKLITEYTPGLPLAGPSRPGARLAAAVNAEHKSSNPIELIELLKDYSANLAYAHRSVLEELRVIRWSAHVWKMPLGVRTDFTPTTMLLWGKVSDEVYAHELNRIAGAAFEGGQAFSERWWATKNELLPSSFKKKWNGRNGLEWSTDFAGTRNFEMRDWKETPLAWCAACGYVTPVHDDAERGIDCEQYLRINFLTRLPFSSEGRQQEAQKRVVRDAAILAKLSDPAELTPSLSHYKRRGITRLLVAGPLKQTPQVLLIVPAKFTAPASKIERTWVDSAPDCATQGITTGKRVKQQEDFWRIADRIRSTGLVPRRMQRAVWNQSFDSNHQPVGMPDHWWRKAKRQFGWVGLLEKEVMDAERLQPIWVEHIPDTAPRISNAEGDRQGHLENSQGSGVLMKEAHKWNTVLADSGLSVISKGEADTIYTGTSNDLVAWEESTFEPCGDGHKVNTTSGGKDSDGISDTFDYEGTHHSSSDDRRANLIEKDLERKAQRSVELTVMVCLFCEEEIETKRAATRKCCNRKECKRAAKAQTQKARRQKEATTCQ